MLYMYLQTLFVIEFIKKNCTQNYYKKVLIIIQLIHIMKKEL